MLLRKEATIRQKRYFLYDKMHKEIRTNQNTDDFCTYHEELITIDQKTEKLHQLLATFRRCELIEIMFQTCIACILMFMNWYQLSLTSVELQGFFDESSNLLIIYLLLSGRKVLIVCLHVQQSLKNGFQTMFGKILLGLHIILSAIVRVCAVVLYFSVPTGMFHFLIHYKYETTNTTWREELVYTVFDKDTEKYKTIFLSNITSELLSSRPVTHYIGLELGHYYIIFLIGILLHILYTVAVEEMKRRQQRENNENFENIPENLEWKGNPNYVTKRNETSQELPSESSTLNNNAQRKTFLYSIIKSSTTLISPVASSDWDDVEFAEDVRYRNDYLMVNLEIKSCCLIKNLSVSNLSNLQHVY